MGSTFSNSIEKTKDSIKSQVEEELLRRMMIQREVQMAVNIAKARDSIHIFGSLWLTLLSGVSVAKIAGKPVPSVVGIPILAGGVLLGNMADMAYGNKLQRVNREAEYLLANERARFVPFEQAPFARFYSPEERSIMLDKATPVGDLLPFSTICRHFTPGPKKDQ